MVFEYGSRKINLVADTKQKGAGKSGVPCRATEV